MIKITMNEILSVVPVLQELSNKQFKGATTFKIARLIRELDKEMALFNEARQKLGDKYGQRDENGELIISEEGIIKLQEDKIQDCNEELVTLLETEIEINADKIKVDAFDDIDISPAQVMILESLVDYE